MEKIDDAALESALGTLAAWTRSGDVLVRVVRCRGFTSAVELIDRIAVVAEARNHHPDLCLTGYRMLEIRLTTHAAGGITRHDLDLAAAIDDLVGD
jgi:4a-hydroxytetrahydrobiopterin dehydratase